MDTEHTDVLVVGGGLVGLSTAMFLAARGVPTILVERHRGVPEHPRSRGLNPRTMELLRGVGVEERVRAAESARALAGNSGVIAVETLAGKEIGELRQAYHADPGADYGDVSPAGWCLCHQDESEPILRDHARALGADIRFGCELLTFTQSPDEVTATVRDLAAGQVRTLVARYLVAADGATSPVRAALGIPTAGPGRLTRFVNIQFEADLRAPLRGRRFIICYTAQAGTRCALLPIDNATRWLLHAMDDGSAPFDSTRCLRLVRAAVGVADLDVRLRNVLPWDAAAAVAERFADGRVFLAGDAAHVMPPSGAFGSNTGIQDAHNLAWKLAMVLDGRAGEELLDTYDAERRPVAVATVEQAVLRSRDRPRMVHQEPGPADPRIRPDPVVILNYRYASTAVVGTEPAAGAVAGGWPDELRGEPGTRVPHVPLHRAGGALSTVDICGPGFTLLAAGADDAAMAWRTAAAQAAATTGVAVAAYQITPADRTGPDVLTDPDDRWAAVSACGSRGALLVRPDGFVGWRVSDLPADPTADLTHALARILSRQPVAAASSGRVAASPGRAAASTPSSEGRPA